MKKTENEKAKILPGSMLNQKTNEDFNKQKPNPQGPNSETQITYTCPVHQTVKMGRVGNCPRCGMELVENK